MNLTLGFTGADLAAMANESLLSAIHTKQKPIHDTRTLRQGYNRVATYSQPRKPTKKDIFSFEQAQKAYFLAGKKLFSLVFKKSFQNVFQEPFLGNDQRVRNPRYLKLQQEEKRKDYQQLPKKYLKLELIYHVIGLMSEVRFLEKVTPSSFRLSDHSEQDLVLATQLRATPPAKQRFFSPVSFEIPFANLMV